MFDSLTDRLRDIEARQRALDVERAEVVAVWGASGEWGDDGSGSPAARLVRETVISGQQARERVRVAGLLQSSMPATRAAMEALGWPKVRLLANAINHRTADAFARHEPLLVEHALDLSVDQLALFLAHWRCLVDEDGANADADSRHEGSFVQLTTSWAGEGYLTGRLDAESAAIVTTALDAITEELYRSERRAGIQARMRGDEPDPARSSSERAADALVEMARRSMAATAAEANGVSIAPAKPLVLINIDVDSIGIVRARLANGTPFPTTDAVRLSCDAVIARVVTSEGVVPLELGRATRDPSEGQRRALSAIWATCAYTGCDRPFAWCDLHHVWHWDHGGPTDVGWLLPLCKHHHRQHHNGVFTIERRPDNTFAFHRADGAPIGDANPTISQLLGVLRRLSTAA